MLSSNLLRPRLLYFGLFAALFFCGATTAFSQTFTDGNKYVQASLLIDRETLQPANDNAEVVGHLGILLKIEPGWHIYWKNSGEAALPTQIKWKLPDGWRVGALEWPAPQQFIERGDIITYGYANEVLLSVPVFSPSFIPEDGSNIKLNAEVRWLVCKDICVPGQEVLEASVPFSTSEALIPSADINLFNAYAETHEQDIEKLRTQLLEKNILLTVDVIPNQIAIRPKTEAVIGLLVGLGGRGVEELAIEQQIQVFPETAEWYETGRASIVPLPNNFCFIRIPISFLDSVPEKPTVSGIAVLSGAKLGLTHDLTFGWSAVFDLANANTEISQNAEFEKFAKNAVADQPLRFRTSSYQHARAENLRNLENASVETSLLIALVSAFIAGILLNLMPCVLPIISIKVMGFIEQADQPRRVALFSALSFASGILATFFALALTVVSLRSVGQQLGWGFQFQHPAFVLALILIVFILSLGFFDLYNFKLPGMQQANDLAGKLRIPFVKHFFDGVLATALSTPCTAPFLGTALAFAFTQSASTTFAVFLSLGSGLALPYVLISAIPAFQKLIPKPGEWMYTFRHIMGFLMLGTVVWLLFVLSQLTKNGLVSALVLLLFLFFSLWMLRTMQQRGRSRAKIGVAQVIFLLVFSLLTVQCWPELTTRAGTKIVNESQRILWKAYSEQLLAQATAEHRVVFIDFTADWCITCKANETLVIETDDVASAIRDNNILAIKADWTTGDAEITKALESYGGTGVPYYVVIPADRSEPIVLPTLLTQTRLIDVFDSLSN